MNKRPEVGAALSLREEQLLLHLSKGCTITKASREMFVSLTTAKTAASHLYIKLNARTAAEAVSVGFRLGYLD
jgi:DNA-binding NarL/FixJ family response regulator